MYLSYILLVYTCLTFSVESVTWYQGCYIDRTDQIGLNGEIIRTVDSPLVDCAKLCVQKGFKYVGLQKGDNCVCLNDTQSLSAVHEANCSQRCADVASGLSLWCGGDQGQWSLYLAAGPYLMSFTAQIDATWIVKNTEVSLDVNVEFASFINFTKGTDEEWLRSCDLAWEVAGERFSDNVKGNGSRVSSRSLFTFPEAGTFHVEVKASNAISSLTRIINVTVILPEPRDLQIVPLSDSDNLPSCIPEMYDDLLVDSTVIAAFVNVNVTLEVSVAVGINLTFILRHGKKGAVSYQEYKTTPDCPEIPCHAIVKDFEFPETGVYVVAASVTNKYGSLQKNITVVVMEHKLGNVSFDLRDETYILKTDEPVKFLVTLETTARQHTSLEVNFGIGAEKKMSLREQKNRTLENGTIFLEGKPPLDGFGLTASYGEGCNLSIVFEYTYIIEGTYSPKIHISSTTSFLTLMLKQDLQVQKELSGPKLHSDGPAMVNQSVEIFLYLQKTSVNLSVVWTILDKEKALVDNITASQVLNYTFQEAGRYEVIATASNMISSVSTSTPVFAQNAIEGLSMDCHPEDYAVVLQEVVCWAEIEEGTDVTFHWNFRDQSRSLKTEGNQTSTVVHKYNKEGEYLVSLMVSNRIDRKTLTLKKPIRVEKEIKSIHFFRLSNTELVNKTSSLYVLPACDCKVDLQFDFGQGRREYEVSPKRNPYHYIVKHNFTSAGIWPVTVYVFNNVSNVTDRMEVMVQDPVGKFDIQVQGHSVRGMPTVFMVMRRGRILERKDFIYKWSFPDGRTKETLIPITQFVFDAVGNYNVNVTIRNFVDSVSKQLEVRVHERAPAGVGIEHPVIVRTYEEVDFTLLGINLVNVLTVNYSDGEVEQYFDNQLSWKHGFSEPGVYEVSATINGNGTTTILRSYIAAEEPIGTLLLDGLSAIKIENNDKLYEWTAVSDKGSHLLYTWSVNNVTTNKTTDNKFTPNVFSRAEIKKLHFRAGIKTLHVRAENDISSAQATINLTVQYPIAYIELYVNRVPLGTPSNVTVTIMGGKHFTLSCDFGDGTLMNTSSRAHNGVIETVQTPEEDQSIPPIYRLVLSHVYQNIGEYNITVNASNLFSWVSENSVAVVGEPISGINVTTESDATVAINTPVTVSVTVASGKDLEFEWELKDVTNQEWFHPEVISDGNTSNVTYRFSLADKYQVIVKISNSFYPKPVVGSLPFLIHALEPMTGLGITTKKKEIVNGTEATFKAVMEQGSNVVFHFDFGDGATQSQNGTSQMLTDWLFGLGVHTYTEVGVYTVKVTASNPFGNKTATLQSPVYVQVPPTLLEGRLINVQDVCSIFGTNFTVTANPVAGTNISYNWNLADETTLIDAGLVIRHQYRTLGTKTVRVEAANKVGKLEALFDVRVVNEIQGVNVTVPKFTIATGKRMNFTAIPEPYIPHNKGVNFEWNFNGHWIIHKERILYGFKTSGKKIVTVAASNCGSRAVSKALIIHVMAPVKGLTLLVKGESLVNQTIAFEEQSWSGDHLKFTWDFGDGTQPLSGDNRTATHIYRRTGEYIVNLTAANNLSSDSATYRLFILEKICKPPVITIIGSKKKNFTFFRSEQVYIETGIQINCSASQHVIYNWTFVNSTDVDTGRIMLDKQSLILPPLALPLGEYQIQLRVTMTETIVYSVSEVYLNIVPSPLKSIIKGGMLRTIGYGEKYITLNGSTSSDPDNNSYIRHNWTCETLPDYRPCFSTIEVEQAGVNLTTPILTLPTEFLEKNESRFMFLLEVSTVDGRKATSDQVIEFVRDEESMRLMISCHQCNGEWVNTNKKISLRTECDNCPSDVSYSWTVFLIFDDNKPETQHRESNNCHPWIGSEKLSLMNKTKPIRTAPTHETIFPHTTSSLPTSTTKKTTPSREAKSPEIPFEDKPYRNNVQESLDIDFPIPQEQPSDFPNVQEEPSAGRKLPGDARCGPPPTIENGEISDVTGRALGDTATYVCTSGTLQGDPMITCKNDGTWSSPPKCPDAFDPNFGVDPSPPKIHMTSRITHVFPLPANKTFTGLDKQSLVIQPNYLHQNRTYIVRVSASAKGMPVAYAETYFRVNRSPIKGTCSITPTSGIEMGTFHVFCKGWQDKDNPTTQPLTYEVSYNMTPGGHSFLVYRGGSHEIDFRLPAGLADANYTVHLSVSILDKFGAETAYCFIPVVVRPKDSWNSKQLGRKQKLFRLNAAEDELLSRARDRSDNRTLCTLISNIATRLNRLPKAHSSTNELYERQRIRNDFLYLLEGVPIRDEAEVIQVAQSLVATTAVPDELNETSLELALKLLESIQARASVLYANTVDPNEDMLTFATQVVSSIVGTMAQKNATDFPKQLTTKSVTVLHELLKVELHHHSIGEIPIQRSAEYVSVVGSHYTPGMSPTIRINDAQFKLPSNMATITQTGRKISSSQEPGSINTECLEAHLTSFKKNPFPHLGDGIWKVETEVVSLNLYACDGENITVANLTSDSLVEIQIPQREKQKAIYSDHVLDKKYMNIHQFNLTKQNINQSLHISIQLDPVSGRTFPISVLISYLFLPNPKRSHLQRQFPVGMDNLKIFLPSGTLNRTGMYYIGIVDSHYNAGRHREGQVLARNYTFSLWLGNCLFWNETQEAWSPNGCQLMEQSTAERLHCRCNHLTAFGGHFELVPNDLSFINVDNFFNLNQNPVTIILVSLVFCIYFVLLALCRQADRHDEKKGGVVYLKDNGGSDKQQYEVTVETGFRMGAGSTAKISIIIHGEEGMSETRELFSDDSRPLFERNSRDKFVMTHPDSLGKIKKVQLWHNNSGPSPSWYLSRVLVKDLVTGHVYYFLCEKWFAVEEEDGKVEREIMALDGNLGFSKVFWAKGTQYMADFHLWASLLTRPSYSRFTRTQRLTCCLTLLMSYMCLNAMWYKESQPEVRGEFGLLDASWQNLTVGAIICTIIIPLNLMLGFLFRRSRVHFPGLEPEGNKQSEEHSTETQEETVQPTMMYSLLDQSILNWQSIQEWAQKQWLKREQAVRSVSNSVKTNNQSQSPQSETPSALPVLQTLRKEEETDVASSGFEDSTSQAYSQGAGERNRIQATPTETTETTPSPSPKCHIMYHREHCNLHASRRIFLPFWCRYVAWTLCCIITVFCAGITVLYGFRFGKTKSTMWIQSLYFSFMICIFIAQPFLILLTVVYTALRHRRDLCILDHYDDGFYVSNNEANRRRKQREVDCCEECEELERGVAARQRSRYLRFARPPQEKTLIEARKKIIKEKKTLALFRDSLAFSIMFLLLVVMAYGKDTGSPFYCNQAIRELLVKSGSLPFTQIKTRGDWLKWSQSTLLEAVYEHSVPDSSRKPMMLIGPLNSYLIGQVHIRQLRVREEDCVVYKDILVTESCRYHYSSSRKDDSIMDSPNSSWTRPASYSFIVWGKHGSYDNTGSTVQLSLNRSEAYGQLRELKTSNWLNIRTRAVIVEFTLLNVPTNLFSSVTLLLEIPPTGAADPNPIIMSTQIFRYITYWDHCVLACELMFVIVTMLTIRCELCALVRQQRKYFSNLWNYLEMTFGLLSLIYIGCYVFRFVLVADIVEDLRNTFYEEFVNISFLAVWDELLRGLVGMLFFFVMVKSLPVLSYVRVCAKYTSIYKRARKELVIFMALFAFILFAFTSLGVALFGCVSLGLRNAWFGLFSMTALMTRIYSHSRLDHPDSMWWPLFVVFYLVFGVGLLMSYMVAVLTRRLKVFKHGEVPLMDAKGGLKYLGEKFLFWSGIRRVQPMEEPENVLPPEFTMAEIEYQVDELLFRMNNLSGSSGLPEKPQGYLTDSTDASNGAGDDGISSGGSEDHAVMDPNRLDHRVQKIEDKLYANEPYLAQLIKLDSIGADVLSQEKEKQLRSHLELEVFRHLQMQRSESGATGEFPSNQTPVIMATLYGSSLEGSPSSGSTGSHKLPQLELPKTLESVTNKQMCIIPMMSPALPWTKVHGGPVSPSDIHPDAGSSSPESPHTKRPSDTKPKVKVGPPLPPKPTGKQLLGKGYSGGPCKPSKPSSSSENASPQSSESEKHHRRTDSSSGHSGSVERGGSLKRPTVKPELPPKPTFIQTALKEQSHLDSTKSLSGSQKLRQFKLPPERVLQRGDLCGNIAAESSSGSEQDAAHVGRRPSGKRNLRKTKSRGKGKGSGSLSPALMLEDLALENPDNVDLAQVGMIEEFVIQEHEL